MSSRSARVIALIHHRMLVPCVSHATVERQSRKVVRRVDLYRGRVADMTRLPSRDRVDTSTRYAGSARGRPMEKRTRPTIALEGDGPADAFATALRRAQAEFLEMPGLQLTEAQAARLWSFDSALCSAVLTALVESRFLVRTRKASFSRA